MSDDLGKLILRLTVGGLILLHGVYKIMNPGSVEFISEQLATLDHPPPAAY